MDKDDFLEVKQDFINANAVNPYYKGIQTLLKEAHKMQFEQMPDYNKLSVMLRKLFDEWQKYFQQVRERALREFLE